MINLDSAFRSRDLALPAEVCLVKTTVLPVATHGRERWGIKKAER